MESRKTGRKRKREKEKVKGEIKLLDYIDNNRKNFYRSWSLKLDYALVFCVARSIKQVGTDFVLYSQKKKGQPGVWIEIAKIVSAFSDIGGTKNGKHCRERFLNNLSPLLSLREWSGFENRVIMEFKYFFGSKGGTWSNLRKVFGNRRSGNQIKNHYNLRLHKLFEDVESRTSLVHELIVSSKVDGRSKKKRAITFFKVDFSESRKRLYERGLKKKKEDNDKLTVIPRNFPKRKMIRMSVKKKRRRKKKIDEEQDFENEWSRKYYYTYGEVNKNHHENLVSWAEEIIRNHHCLLRKGQLEWFQKNPKRMVRKIDTVIWKGKFDGRFWKKLARNPILFCTSESEEHKADSPKKKKKKMPCSAVEHAPEYVPPPPGTTSYYSSSSQSRRRKKKPPIPTEEEEEECINNEVEKGWKTESFDYHESFCQGKGIDELFVLVFPQFAGYDVQMQ